MHEAIDLGVNFFDTAAYFGNAEERLGKALVGRRDRLIVGTKAGRFGYTDFDFSPTRIRRSLENSLRLLKTDYVDILQLHDIEYVPLRPVFEDSYAELAALRDKGLCRYIGMSGYPLDISFVANQYSLQRSGCATTLIGSGKSRHLRSAAAAIETPLDDELIAELLALRPPAAERTWPTGLPENIAIGDRLSKRSPAARSRTIVGKDAT